MPVYEYRCNKCRRLVTQYVRGFADPPKAICSACGSEELTRLFSRFTIGKTYRDFYDEILSDRELEQGMMANDPRALAKWSRKMDAAAGGEIGPEHEDMLERMENGEPWEKLVAEARQEESGPSEGSESPEEA